jgi:hypothetical protein
MATPAGRPLSCLTLAAQVRHLTRDGAELVGFLLAVTRGETLPVPGGPPQQPSRRQRMYAARGLLERALVLLEPGDVHEILAVLDAEARHIPRRVPVAEDSDPVA